MGNNKPELLSTG